MTPQEAIKNLENAGLAHQVPGQRLLFEIIPPKPKPRRKPRKLMHVVDAGPCESRDHETIVVMECNRCDLKTDWFAMPTVTAAKRGIECPRCSGKEFSTNDYGEYVVD